MASSSSSSAVGGGGGVGCVSSDMVAAAQGGVNRGYRSTVDGDEHSIPGYGVHVDSQKQNYQQDNLTRRFGARPVKLFVYSTCLCVCVRACERVCACVCASPRSMGARRHAESHGTVTGRLYMVYAPCYCVRARPAASCWARECRLSPGARRTRANSPPRNAIFAAAAAAVDRERAPPDQFQRRSDGAAAPRGMGRGDACTPRFYNNQPRGSSTES